MCRPPPAALSKRSCWFLLGRELNLIASLFVSSSGRFSWGRTLTSCELGLNEKRCLSPPPSSKAPPSPGKAPIRFQLLRHELFHPKQPSAWNLRALLWYENVDYKLSTNARSFKWTLMPFWLQRVWTRINSLFRCLKSYSSLHGDEKSVKSLLTFSCVRKHNLKSRFCQTSVECGCAHRSTGSRHGKKSSRLTS